MPEKTVWDKIYAKYEGIDEINLHLNNLLQEFIEKKLAMAGTVLEAGCGSAFLLSRLQKKGFECTALDLNKKPLEIAKKQGIKRTVQGNLLSMPFKENSFDLVFNEGVLEHFTKKQMEAACREMARTSKRAVIIAVPNKYTWWVVRKHWLMLRGKWIYGFESSLSAGELERLMQKCGLKNIEVRGIHLLPPIRAFAKISEIPGILADLSVPIPKNSLPSVLNASEKIEKAFPSIARALAFEIAAFGEKEAARKK